MCCLLDIHLVNGRIKRGEKGEFTCITNEGASIVDYNIASSELFENIFLFHEEDRDESVHLPLKCVISFTYQTEEPIQNTELADRQCQSHIRL